MACYSVQLMLHCNLFLLQLYSVVFYLPYRKQLVADDKAEIRDIQERFLLGND